MRKQYAQYAQQEMAIGDLSNPTVGMQSIFFDADDTGFPKRIDTDGTIHPVGGVRRINDGGKIGWGLAIDRSLHLALGSNSIDFSLSNASTGTSDIEAGANGDNSISVGMNANAREKGIAIGYDVEGSEGISIGESIRLGDRNSIVLGKYNDTVTGSIFEIGVGYFNDPSEVRLNAFVIANTGVASTPLADKGNIVNPKDLVTLEKLEEEIVKADPDYDEHTFSIKGDILDGSFLGFLPYIPLGSTKKIIGMRWFLRTGSCSITLVEYGNITDSTIFSPLGVTGGTIGQFIHANPNDYYNLTDGHRVQLEVTNSFNAVDLSVTVIVLRE